MAKKRYTDTYAKICDPDNIRAALFAAARGKRKKRSVQKALANEDATVERIRDILVNHREFLPAVRIGHQINDGIRRKKRVIVHPTFDEQIIDHALLQVIGPHFMRRFYRWSCGSIPGRGQESMSKYVKRKILAKPKRCRHYAKLDIRKCFDTLDTAAVFAEIAKTERDPETLRLVRYKLDRNAVRLPDGSIRRGGVPIGLYTSPWFVNIALTPFDHRVKDDLGVYVMVRFADDILMVDGNGRVMKRAIVTGTGAATEYGFGWKSRPVVRRWAAGDAGKMRFCGIHFTRETAEIRDEVFVRARRTMARISWKRRTERRVTWYDAAKVISYGGRFRGFGAFAVFGRHVLRGMVDYASMRRKISAHDRIINKSKENSHEFAI